MSTVAAPADRRFRRAHVKPARRRYGRAGWVRQAAQLVAVAVLVAIGCYRATAAAVHAHMLQVDRIVVYGNQRLSQGEVLAVLSGLRGESLLLTDLDRWRLRLLASPWVRDAELRRSLPSTIEVAVSERRPVGIGRIGGETYLVDETGTVIDQFGPEYADLDLPIIDGLTTVPGSAGTAADQARAELAGRVIAALNAQPQVARRLSQLDVSDLHDATALIGGDTTVIHLGDDHFLQRLQSYLDVAAALRDQVANIDYVDVRFDGRIYVGSAPAPSALRRDKPAEAGAARRRDRTKRR
jgi:cell division protein FtsQ